MKEARRPAAWKPGTRATTGPRNGREIARELTCTMRRFVLDREEDVSGISGVGVVAEGVQFTDGTAVLRWTVGPGSTAIYNSVEELMEIHGHDGKTLLRWVDGGG
jgi:hypothetical protein